MTDEIENQTAPAVDGEEAAPVDNLLGLKMLVVFMGVLCVVAFITLVLLIVMKKPEEEAAAPVEITTTIAEGEEVPESVLVLAPGEEIVDMSLQGRSLALRIKSPDGERILIVDPYTSDHRAVITIEAE